MNPTTDTPRTDAAVVRCACSSYVVEPDFARSLEREIAALRTEVERLTNELHLIGDMAVGNFDDAVVGAVDKAVQHPPPKTYKEYAKSMLFAHQRAERAAAALRPFVTYANLHGHDFELLGYHGAKLKVEHWQEARAALGGTK
jgi:hypothetical protein